MQLQLPLHGDLKGLFASSALKAGKIVTQMLCQVSDKCCRASPDANRRQNITSLAPACCVPSHLASAWEVSIVKMPRIRPGESPETPAIVTMVAEQAQQLCSALFISTEGNGSVVDAVCTV